MSPLITQDDKLQFMGEAIANESLPPRGRGTTKWWKEPAGGGEAKFVSPQRILPQSPAAPAPSRREPYRVNLNR